MTYLSFWLQKTFIPPTPLADDEVTKILSEMEEVIRYRLRISEIIPLEMSRYRIGMSCHTAKTFERLFWYSRWARAISCTKTL